MRLRTLLATAMASTLVAGVTGTTALAASVPSPAKAGSAVAWGNAAAAGDAMDVPVDMTSPVTKVAVNSRATAAVTADGHLRVWGQSDAFEVTQAPTNITDATSVALAMNAGAVLHADGKITAWGAIPAFVDDLPSDLRAKAIAITATGTGYAVRTDGTLAVWGVTPAVPVPTTGLTDLVDIASGGFQALALHADGTVTAWGYEDEEVTGFNTVPNLGGKKVTQITTGTFSNGVVLEDGTIKTWGFMPVAGEPADFGGKKVISLDLSNMAAAVTEDGVVHTWGAPPTVSTIPPALTGQPVASVVVGSQHAVAIVTAFRDLTKPTITGTPQVGKTLTATPATFSLAPTTTTGQWYTGATPIAGQSATTLTLTQALAGKKISYRTTATRGAQTVASTSTETTPVTAAPKANAKIKAKAKATGKTKKTAKKVKITVTVTTTKGISPAGKVTLTLKGKTKKKATAKINTNGKATITLKKVKRGKYKATLTYTGNTNVNPTKTTTKIKI